MDEPLSGVDPAARDSILDIILKNYTEDSTVMLSTHLIYDVERIFDDVVVMDYGRLIAADSADALREKAGEIPRRVFPGGVQMLGKLLKYEVKAAGKVMPALYLGIGLTYGLGKLAEVLGIEQMKTGFGIACAGVGIAAMVLALILTVMRYAKGLFGAEGYLTQTLPSAKAR